MIKILYCVYARLKPTHLIILYLRSYAIEKIKVNNNDDKRLKYNRNNDI